MKVLKKAVNRLIAEEHVRMSNASKDIPSSPYEAYALLLKLTDETADDFYGSCHKIETLWESIKSSREAEVITLIDSLRAQMLLVACDAIQVSAMCEKALENLGQLSRPKEAEDLRKELEEVTEAYD